MSAAKWLFTAGTKCPISHLKWTKASAICCTVALLGEILSTAPIIDDLTNFAMLDTYQRSFDI